MDKVLKTIKQYNLINQGDEVIIGLSGGPDSVSLFHSLRRLRESLGFELHAVHVNHMLRQVTAVRDQEFVHELCYEYDVPYYGFEIDCQKLAGDRGISSEEAGREARYKAFREVADKLKTREGGDAAVKIAVAHNADDQAETVLFRILRGTGIDGIAGMEFARAEGEHTIIRPLLDVTRKEIERYLKERDYEFMTDETNEQPAYARNKIRLELLPYIKENYNRGITAGLCRLADLAGTDKDYLWQQAEIAYKECVVIEVGDGVVLDRAKVVALHQSMRGRVFMKALRRIGMWQDITHERLDAAEEMLHAQGGTKVVELPHGYRITFAYDTIRIRLQGESGAHTETLANRLSSDPEEIEEMLETVRKSGYPYDELWIDADKLSDASGVPVDALEETVTFRSRMRGDVIPLNGGTKSLKKLLGEMKIPADERDDALLVAAGSCVVYVASRDGKRHRFAESLKIDNKTRTAIIMKIV